MKTTRRRLMQSAGALALAAALPARLRAAPVRFTSDPFVLGVASGCPTPRGVVLWTRLITSLGEPGRELSGAVPVDWEIATDDAMRVVVRRGSEVATPEFAWSVHVEADGLEPGREYWYRFTAGGARSPVGRTRTAPAPDAQPAGLRVGVVSCQRFEAGYFTAYRHLVADAPDLIAHTGDYIYEYASRATGDGMRGDGSGETFTLEDYRARHALYRSDPDLLAAHAACPWLLTWDDHEVVNDYAGDTTYAGASEAFLARRAAAYRAYYEHMPLPRSALPHGPHMRLHLRRGFGRLLDVHVLDTRQHRSPLACLGPQPGGGRGARCAELFDAARTKLGVEQEAWLRTNLAAGTARWNFFVQGTTMAHADFDPGPGVGYRRDSWDGYPAARQRFMDTLVETAASNPVVIDGDIHAFVVANLHRRADDLSSAVIASEFTTTSISSPGIPQHRLDTRRKNNPNILFANSTRRGYLLLSLEPDLLRADLVGIDSVRERAARREVMASYVVHAGKPGPVRAQG